MKYHTIIKYKKFIQKIKLILGIIVFLFMTIVLIAFHSILGVLGIVAGGFATIPPYMRAEKEIKEMEMIEKINKEKGN